MSAIDTPDYQRGVVSAQLLLATNAAYVTSCIVGIPPNAETMVVIVPGGGQSIPPLATGQTSGQTQRGIPVNLSESSGLVTSWFFDVTSVVDDQVEVQIEDSSPDPWYVYSDSGVHIVSDGTKLSNQLGEQYVIPTVPNTVTGDHPPVELSFEAVNGSSTTTLVADPGTGKRLRVFSMYASCFVSGGVVVIQTSSGGQALITSVGLGSVAMNLPGQGYPVPTGNGLVLAVASSGDGNVGVFYTTEFV